jgi:hypothetical protein
MDVNIVPMIKDYQEPGVLIAIVIMLLIPKELALIVE